MVHHYAMCEGGGCQVTSAWSLVPSCESLLASRYLRLPGGPMRMTSFQTFLMATKH